MIEEKHCAEMLHHSCQASCKTSHRSRLLNQAWAMEATTESVASGGFINVGWKMKAQNWKIISVREMDEKWERLQRQRYICNLVFMPEGHQTGPKQQVVANRNQVQSPKVSLFILECLKLATLT